MHNFTHNEKTYEVLRKIQELEQLFHSSDGLNPRNAENNNNNQNKIRTRNLNNNRINILSPNIISAQITDIKPIKKRKRDRKSFEEKEIEMNACEKKIKQQISKTIGYPDPKNRLVHSKILLAIMNENRITSSKQIKNILNQNQRQFTVWFKKKCKSAGICYTDNMEIEIRKILCDSMKEIVKLEKERSSSIERIDLINVKYCTPFESSEPPKKKRKKAWEDIDPDYIPIKRKKKTKKKKRRKQKKNKKS